LPPLYGDYTRKSFEDGKSFVEKLAGVKSLDKALEVQTEYAKSAYETFVAEVAEDRRSLRRSRQGRTYKPIEGPGREIQPPVAAALIQHGFPESKKPPAVTAGVFLASIRRII